MVHGLEYKESDGWWIKVQVRWQGNSEVKGSVANFA